MLVKKKFINYKIRFLFIIFTFCALVFGSFSKSFADCKPAVEDFNSINTGVAPLLDNIIGIVSDGIFGPRINSGSAFTKVANFGDRAWEQGIVYKTFHGITEDFRFQIIFYLLVIAYVTYLGAQFAVGVAQVSARDLLLRYIKIAFIVFLISPSGWEIYLNFVAKNVLEGSRYFNRVITASMYNVPLSKITSPFQPIDMVIGVIFSETTWLKILGLFWASGFLFTAMLIFIFGYVILITGIVLLKVTVTYAAIIILISVLLSLGPIFIVCLLFDRTKGYFDQWIKNIMGLFFEQYLMFLGFFIFCLMITLMIKGLLAFEICYGVAMELKFMVLMPQFIQDIINGLLILVKWITFGAVNVKLPEHIIYESIPLVYSYKPTAIVNDLPSNIFTAGGIFIITTMFSKFIDGVSSLSNKISGGSMDSSSLANEMTKNPFNAKGDGLLDKFKKLEGAVTSGAIKTALDIGTGRALISAPNKLKNRAQELAKSIEQRENDPEKQSGFSKFVTNAMKAERKLVSGAGKALGSNLTSKIMQTDFDMNEVNKMEGLQQSRQKMIDNKVNALVGQGKKYSSASEIKEKDKADIIKNIDSELASNMANKEIQELQKKGEVSQGLQDNIRKNAIRDVKKSHDSDIRMHTAISPFKASTSEAGFSMTEKVHFEEKGWFKRQKSKAAKGIKKTFIG